MQFFEGDSQSAAGPSLGEQPVRGVHLALIDRLSFYKKITKSCVLDEGRHATMKGW